MEKNRNLIIRILFIALAVLLVGYFVLTNRNQKRYQWSESYKANSDQPYGTLFIQKLLAGYRSDRKFTINEKTPLHELLDSTLSETDYVFVGQEIYLDDADRNALLHFISAGNNAFISTVNLPFDVVDSVFVPECGNEIFTVKDETVSATMNFYNRSVRTSNGYKYSYRFGKSEARYFWNTLNPALFCDSTKSLVPLGYMDPDKVNFFKLRYGKGTLYIHTNPLVFTNYFLAKPDKAEYASSVFSHLEGRDIIWDEFSKAKFIAKNNAPEMSPISYILQHDTLRYAWWLILGGAILYTLFTAKRRQKVIPVLEGKTNTSLEFINIIAALHFQNGNHRDIAKKKIKYFFYFIKTKYGLHTQTLSESSLKRLAEKSNLDMADLQSIAREFNYTDDSSYYDEQKLISLHKGLDKFYKQCK